MSTPLPILPKFISPKQAMFVKGRHIIDNVSLAHELVKNLNRKVCGHNLVLKLDMAKTYDRLEWDFLLAVMRRFGFSPRFCSLTGMLVSNCWFSVIFDGMPTGYFQSSRGLRQGDPLAPALFIIAEVVLSHGITNLFQSGQIQYYKVPCGYPNISHFYSQTILLYWWIAVWFLCVVCFNLCTNMKAPLGSK